jgi:hypothetical protein
VPPLQYTNRSSSHLRIYSTKLDTLSYDYDTGELIALTKPDLFEPRKELNPFTSFEEVLDDRDLIPLHEYELTLIQLAAESKIPNEEDFKWWYHNDRWRSIEDEEGLTIPYDWAIHRGGQKRVSRRSGWTNYGTSLDPDDLPSIKTVVYRPRPLYSPALVRATQNRSTKKRQRCLEDSSPSQRQEEPPSPPPEANDCATPAPRVGTNSCPAPTTPPSQKKRKLTHSK